MTFTRYRSSSRPAPVLPDPDTLPFPANIIRQCRDCDLHKSCTAPVPGDGPIPSEVMFVAEAPGQEEDERGFKPLVGRSGQQFDSNLFQISLNREETYITNVLKCRPPNNRDPRPSEIRVCSKWLNIELSVVKPRIVVAMGAPAIGWFLGLDAGTVEHLHGRPVEIERDGRKIIVLPCYHPAAALRNTSLLRFLYEDFQVLRGLIKGNLSSEYVVVDEFPNPVYEVADTPEKLRRMTDEIKAIGEVAGDVETFRQNTQLWSAQLSSIPNRAWFVPVNGSQRKYDLTRYGVEVIVHHYLNDNQWFDIPEDNFFDSMVAAYLLGLPQGLKELASRLCGIKMINYSEMVRPGQKRLSIDYLNEAERREWPDPPVIEETKWDNKAGKIVTKTKKPWHISRKIKSILKDTDENADVDPYKRWCDIEAQERAVVESVLGPMPESSLADIGFSDAVAYSCRDAVATLRVKHKLRKLLEEADLLFLFHCIDQACLPMVSHMMAVGMPVDTGYLKELSQYYLSGMEKAAAQAAAKIGHSFNPASSPQVATVIYSELGFKPTRKTAAQLISTDDRELKKVSHPVVADILEYRRLSKNRGTYAEGLASLAVRHKYGGIESYRLHSDLKVTRTETGRLSSSKPNMQNIPKRTEEGKKIKKAFRPSPGWVLMEGDFSQQEVRVQAHISKCKRMIDMFLRGADFHTETAAHIFGVSMEEAKNTKYRTPAKSTNFGIIYLITPEGLSEKIKEDAADIIVDGKPLDVSEWTVDNCGLLIRDWYRMYPEIEEYQMEKIAEARRKGYVTDLFHRRRYIPEIASPFTDVQETGKRQAVNMPIQSTSQGITKLAMAALWQAWIERARPESELRFLMQIHDAVLLESRGDTEEAILERARWVKKIMDNVMSLSIPMIAEVEWGLNWGEMKKLKLD